MTPHPAACAGGNQIGYLSEKFGNIFGFDERSVRLSQRLIFIVLFGDEGGSGFVLHDAGVGEYTITRLRRLHTKVAQDQFVLLFVEFSNSLCCRRSGIDSISAGFQQGLESQATGRIVVDQQNACHLKVRLHGVL